MLPARSPSRFALKNKHRIKQYQDGLGAFSSQRWKALVEFVGPSHLEAMI